MNKKILLSLLLAVSLSSQAAPTLEEVATSPETFAICKAIDIASTSYIITNGIGYEANPIVAPLIAHGYFPFILVSTGIYWALKHFNNKPAIVAANAGTCFVAAHNLMMIP